MDSELDTRPRTRLGRMPTHSIFLGYATILRTNEGVGASLHFLLLEMVGSFLCVLRTARLPFVY